MYITNIDKEIERLRDIEHCGNWWDKDEEEESEIEQIKSRLKGFNNELLYYNYRIVAANEYMEFWLLDEDNRDKVVFKADTIDEVGAEWHRMLDEEEY